MRLARGPTDCFWRRNRFCSCKSLPLLLEWCADTACYRWRTTVHFLWTKSRSILINRPIGLSGRTSMESPHQVSNNAAPCDTLSVKQRNIQKSEIKIVSVCFHLFLFVSFATFLSCRSFYLFHSPCRHRSCDAEQFDVWNGGSECDEHYNQQFNLQRNDCRRRVFKE